MPSKKKEEEKEEEEDEEEEEEQTPIEFVQQLPDGVRQNVLAMQSLQEKYQGLFMQYLKDVAEVEKKYEALYAPLYARRAAIVSGEKEPTEEEVKKGEEASEATSKVEELPDDDKAQSGAKGGAASDAAQAEKGVPGFWLTAMLNQDTLQDMIKDHDKDALQHLTDIRCKMNDDVHTGFVLEFDFAPNNFFSDTTLTKTCITELDEEDGEDMLKKLVGHPIAWKDGMNLTVEKKKKKQKSKHGKGTRVVTRDEPRESFFSFFSPPEIPDDDDEVDDEVAEKAEEDYEQCTAFKDSLIPRAVDFYTGEAVPMIDFNLGEDEEDEEEEEDGEDGEGKKKKKKKQEECKQQ